ncbi:hypothetical protein OB955_18795 [Halobacteria archaeon AArc-m2/3/4]|uniref:RING-type E3 ubiquitin transferase n=1 Tax=Natronoglomus mannanivorans TaxID=2979990 RepID=A0AAP2Z0B8_9EURY|nr:hypothetical protein [Halobacteria archaeon AArc-xg1-1]MCU4974772.1 hypothetical protein [Halobacteria archaeon AArc-m2/3/4]
MSLEEFAVAGVFAIPAVLFTTWTVYYLWKALRIAVSQPVSVGEAAAGRGTGEFVGTARPAADGTFDAPFSGARALLSTYRILRKSGSSGSWTTKTSGSIERPFLVEGRDGERAENDTILVDPDGAAISPENESVRERTGSALPNDVRLRLSQHQSEVDLETVLAQNATRSRQYVEGYIAPGDRIHVSGGQLEESDVSGVDAKVVAGDGQYRITGGGRSVAVWGFVKKAVVTGIVSIIAAGGVVIALAAAL